MASIQSFTLRLMLYGLLIYCGKVQDLLEIGKYVQLDAWQSNENKEIIRLIIFIKNCCYQLILACSYIGSSVKLAVKYLFCYISTDKINRNYI